MSEEGGEAGGDRERENKEHTVMLGRRENVLCE